MLRPSLIPEDDCIILLHPNRTVCISFFCDRTDGSNSAVFGRTTVECEVGVVRVELCLTTLEVSDWRGENPLDTSGPSGFRRTGTNDEQRYFRCLLGLLEIRQHLYWVLRCRRLDLDCERFLYLRVGCSCVRFLTSVLREYRDGKPERRQFRLNFEECIVVVTSPGGLDASRIRGRYVFARLGESDDNLVSIDIDGCLEEARALANRC